MVKIRTAAEAKDSEKFINDMADKQYGVTDSIERVTISMNGKVFNQLDDIVRKRKRAKLENRTMSALVMEAIEYYLNNHKS